MRCNIYVLVI